MKHYPRAQISSAALKHNLQRLHTLAPKSKIMAVIKADGYGHGAFNVASCLTNADGFAVARVDEALKLRANGINAKILLLEGISNKSELKVLADSNINTVVHHQSQIELLEATTLAQPVNIWIKVDIGMHRLGFTPDQFDASYRRLRACKQVANINVMTHFPCADEPDNQATALQTQKFNELTAGLACHRSLANSAALLHWPQTHADWNRAGLALYGISPFSTKSGADYGLVPAMELISHLIAVREHKAGEPVGYGNYWHAKNKTKLGVVAIGYGDGYPRNAPFGTPVWINGRIVPIVGRVSMDMLTVDLGINATDTVGDEVVLWGKKLNIEDVAKHHDTITYELLCKLTQRVIKCIE